MHDLVIRGGTCFDGLGGDGVVADVAVDGGVIVAVGRVEGSAARTVDAEGMYVAPGFIDGHTHLDAQIFWDPWAGSLIEHGVTSAVMGNCGFTLAPGKETQSDLVLRSIERAEDMSREAIAAGVPWRWTTFPEYMDAVDALPKALNVAVQIGHSALRAAVMGERAFGAEATEDELRQMEIAVRQAMAAGSWGFSTSRSRAHLTTAGEPVASRTAPWSEVVRLVARMGAEGRGMFQLAPERPEDPAELAGFQDRLAELARLSGRPITFMVGGQKEQLDTVDRIIARGGSAAGQVHVRGFENIFGFRTTLPFDRLPSWRALREEPLGEQRRLLADSDRRRRLIDEAEHGDYGEASGAELRRVPYEDVLVIADPDRPERSLAEVAAGRRCHPVEAMIDLAVETDFEQLFRQPISHVPTSLILEGLRHPHTVVAASDSGAHISQILDSNIPTYFLANWVRATETFTWGEAVHMLTGRPAAVWGLDRRGTLVEGSHADMVVFDPATVGCAAPRVVTDLPDGGPRLAQGGRGIRSVIVAGEPVVADGTRTGATPGRLLRWEDGSGP